ncbi:MAG: hypothetical protein ACXAC2_00095 [Candidatus Kariarchaeaceae archaeon]|jgi:hypothetical protein
MSERIIPGVAFAEDGEGLIGTPSPGAVGVLLVGTACKGPLTPQFFGTDQLPDLLEMYGPPDPYAYKSPVGLEPKAELTLSRSAIEIFTGGPPPGGLWCVRVAESDVVTGVGNAITVSDFSSADTPIASGSVVPASWVVTVDPDASNLAVGDRIVLSSATQPTMDGEYWVKTVTAGTSFEVYPIGDATGFGVTASDVAGQGYSPVADGVIKFTAKYPGQWYNNPQLEYAPFQDVLGQVHGAVDTLRIKVPSNEFYDSYLEAGTSDKSQNRWYSETIEIQFNELGATARPTIASIVTALNANETISRYWSVVWTGTAGGDEYIDTTVGFVDIFLDADVGGTNWAASETAVVAVTAVRSALSLLSVKTGRILVIGGCDESVLSGGYITEGITHVKAASITGADQERIFIFGTGNYSTEALLVAAFEASPYPSGEERVVHVTPGINVANPYFGKIYGDDGASAPNTIADINETVDYSGGYAAARVAGVVASFAPDDTALNKGVGATELEYEFARSTLKRAINKSFTVLAKGLDQSFVIRRALTSAGATDPFYQISTRLAVDDIRYALRLTLQGFIGRKNTPRVLQVMNSKAASVMDGYVSREIINTDYEIEVSSTRDQQIIGVVKVLIRFQVVFYIEFIEVNLVLE